MIKKYILGIIFAFSVPLMLAYAANPTLVVSALDDNDSVRVYVTGADPNSPVQLYAESPTLLVPQAHTIGTTDQNGAFTGNVSTRVQGIFTNRPVYVSVNGYESPRVMWPYFVTDPNTATSTNGSIVFSNTSPSVTVGQNGSVTLSGGTGNYYISSNSNSGGITGTISGNTLNLYGAGQGTSTITVCSTNGACGSVVVTANQSSSTVGLSPSSITLLPGHSASISISGSQSPYSVSGVTSGSGISTVLSGNTLTVTGNSIGSTTFNVCSSNGMCSPVSVTVSSSTNPTTTSGPLASTLTLGVGQTVKFALSGGAGSYYLQSPMTTPVMASVNGNMVTILGAMAGFNTVTVCTTGTSTSQQPCLSIPVSVSAAMTGGTSPSGNLTGTGGKFYFTTNLSTGMTGNDVTELQTRLQGEGYYSGPITGYFGPLTEAAVEAYQGAQGLPKTGYVGPLTIASFNKDF